VLLLGETGTGKELVARAIYNANGHGQYIPIDCGSLVSPLMGSDLFGYVKGAFSGADTDKRGLIELADGGTALFDEIGDLPFEMQVKLLRFLQEGEFRAVGALHSGGGRRRPLSRGPLLPPRRFRDSHPASA
jgi:transcriptional regulator with GAF, ATPase, and Fis domain